MNKCIKNLKQRYLILLITLLAFFAGCGESINKDDKPEDLISVNGIHFGDTKYNVSTDMDNCFGYLNVYTKSETGYYNFDMNNSGKILLYMDRELDKVVPVCSRINCTHDNLDCDAVFSEFIYPEVIYNEGYIYTEMIEEAEDKNMMDFYLYKVSADGSKREKVFKMYTYLKNASIIPSVYIHRGCVYYLLTETDNVSLYKKDLKKGEPELIYKYKGEFSDICNIKGYGEGIFFSRSQDGVSYQIAYHSCIDNKTYDIVGDSCWSYAITDDFIYYISPDGQLNKMSLKDLKTQALMDNLSRSDELSTDGKYLYIDNYNESSMQNFKDRKIDVYTLGGEKVDTIDLDKQYSTCDFGDENYMFFGFNDGTKKYFDKSQIGIASHEWKMLG